MIISYFKHYFTFFNVNEHLAVQFVKLARDGSRAGRLRFFFVYTRLLVWAFPLLLKLNLTYCLNLPCYLHFAFCLFVWLIKLKFTFHLSYHEGCFRGIICSIERQIGGTLEPWITEFERGDSRPLLIPWFEQIFSHLRFPDD